MLQAAGAGRVVSDRVAAARVSGCSRLVGDGAFRYWNSNCVSWLACAEGNDAADRIVRRDADGDSIARDYLDPKAAHSAAELGQNFVAGVTLHAVKSAAVHGNHSALHINEIVLAQLLAVLS